MADLLDVETALAALCGAALYPNGTSQPSVAGLDCIIYPGWPNENALAADLAAGKAHITVYSGQNLERDTTRYARQWDEASVTTPTVTAAVSDLAVTIGGTVTTGHYVTLIVAGQPYSYAAQDGDTLSGIASALAALMPAGLGVTVAGAVLTFPATMSGRIVARTGAPGTIARELGRQQRGMMVSVWAPSPQARSAVASALMTAIRGTDFMAMPDASQAWLTYRQSNESDGKQNAMAYRRDINVWVEYATLQTAAGYPVTAFPVTEQGANALGDLGTPITVTP